MGAGVSQMTRKPEPVRHVRFIAGLGELGESRTNGAIDTPTPPASNHRHGASPSHAHAAFIESGA